MANPDGLFIVPNRVTVSTAASSREFWTWQKFRIAHSRESPWLAPTDELRNELMPINKKWPLVELLGACREFEKTLRAGERDLLSNM